MPNAHARPSRRHGRRGGLATAICAATLLVLSARTATAQAPDSAGLVAIARSALAAGSRVMIGDNATQAAAKTNLAARHQKAVAAGLDRATRVRTAIGQHGQRLTGYEDKLEVTAYHASGDSATMSVVYRVRFDRSSSDPNMPKTMKEAFPHELVFTRQGGEWTLASERGVPMEELRSREDPAHALGPTKASPVKPGKGPPPRSRDHRTGFAPRRAPGAFAALRSVSSLTALAHGPAVALIEADANDGTAGTYDAYAAATYSYRWDNAYGTGKNPAYPDFAPAWKQLYGAGDDCTNFTSQVAQAGGWQFVIGSPKDVYAYNQWWLYSESDYSHSWSVAHAFHWWLNYSGRGFWASYNSDALQGDMLQFDWEGDGKIDHAMVISYAGPNDILLNGHSIDYEDEPLSAILARHEPTTQYYIYAMYTSY